MNPELKLHEEKMTKTISVLREDWLPSVPAAPTLPCWISWRWITMACPPALTSWPRYLFRRLVHWSSSHTISLPLNPSRRPFRLLILVSIPITMVLCLRLFVPTSHRRARKDLAKSIAKMGEESKVAIRSIRRDANDKLKAMKKASEITEDDLKNLENDCQKITDKYIAEIDKITAEKEKEIMSV